MFRDYSWKAKGPYEKLGIKPRLDPVPKASAILIVVNFHTQKVVILMPSITLYKRIHSFYHYSYDFFWRLYSGVLEHHNQVCDLLTI